ncbi:MAG TPA: hypothetical protein VNN19_13445, partial [bacterium]|nr:hypothetical protein [bacterium]
LLEIAPAELFAQAGVTLQPRSRAEAGEALRARQAAAAVLTRAEAWTVPLAPTRPLAAVLAEVVSAYRGRVRIYRVPTDDVDALAREYGEQATVVAFPRLEKADILEIAGSAARLPTGITRHLIPGRALRVNVPMALLTAGDDPARLHEQLQALIRQRLLEGSVRYYPEGAFLFDE